MFLNLQSHAFRLCFIVSMILVMAVFMHAAHIDHHHPQGFGEGIEVILHGEDRKWFLTMLLAALLAAFASSVTIFPLAFSLLFIRASSYLAEEIATPLEEAFQRGRIHPKLCG